ncbi:hypothetical protein CLOM_g9289 [Closterium sp. NIES-68]|nr:hypothetical protein CLOM_g9289 [Closterium sp. NIES-68]
MNEVFRLLLDKCVIVYLDYILVYSNSREQHLKDLEAVFTLCDQHRFITKGSNFAFLKEELDFLNHFISTEGVKIDPKKIDTICNWEPPTNVKELQSFMGFVNYMRHFIPKMAESTTPLTELLQKGVLYEWGERQQAAFDQLKTFLITPPVLRIADPDRPYELVTDASDIAVGAVLLQDFGKGLQPIAYDSRKLQGAVRNYPIHDKEMLAIVNAKTWRCYLSGADVTVRTYHKSLQFLRAQPTLNPRQIRWHEYLESNVHYRITYKKGENNIVDALSCPTAHRIWVPSYRLLQELLIQEVHDADCTGHFGVEKTLKTLQRHYYWPNASH